MAITFQPSSSVSFGSVYVGASSAQTITVSNSDTAKTATVSAPSQPGFTMASSSSTVPEATSNSDGSVTNGTLTVTVTFTPPSSQSAASQAYAGSLTVTPTGGSAVACSLQGTGLTGLTISPSQVVFGSLPTGSSTNQTVTATNAGSRDVALTAPAGFSVSPSTIPGRTGAASPLPVTLTITFAPTAAQVYSGSLTDASGAATCTVTGTGTQSAGDTDGFASESGSTSGGGGAGSAMSPGSSSTTGVVNQYYQVVVPTFALNGDTTSPGASFLRLGSFPATNDTTAGFQNSLALANSEVQLLSSSDAAWDPANLTDDGQMLTKGGVWEHTDGNRVVTTAGDKLEIIQGNYNLVVNGDDTAPVTSTTYAPCISSLTGTPSSPIGTGATVPSNPTSPDKLPMTTDLIPGDVFSGTWANRVMSYVGTNGNPVPVVYYETNAGDYWFNTTTSGANNTNTNAGTIVTNITSSGSNTTTTTCGSINNNTTATGGGAITNVTTAMFVTNVTTALQNNFNFGEVANVSIGGMLNLNAGFTANITLLGQFNFSAPECMDLTPDSTEAKATKASLTALETNLANAKTGIAQLSTRINGTETKIANLKTQVNNDWNVICNIGALTGTMFMMGS